MRDLSQIVLTQDGLGSRKYWMRKIAPMITPITQMTSMTNAKLMRRLKSPRLSMMVSENAKALMKPWMIIGKRTLRVAT